VAAAEAASWTGDIGAAVDAGRGGSDASVSMVASRPPMTMRSVITLPSMISRARSIPANRTLSATSFTQGLR
jgi:hypothetical protein